MNTTALVAEFLLIGIVPFFTIVFTSFAIFHVRDISFLTGAKDFSTLLAVLVTMIIYLLGGVTHRLSQLLNMESLHFFSRIPVLKRGLIEYTPQQQIDWFDAYVLILQQGSERLINEIQHHESQIRIFKSIGISIPFLAIPLSLWLLNLFGLKAATFAMFICIVIALFALRAFYIQRSNNRKMVRFAIEHFRQTEIITRDYDF